MTLEAGVVGALEEDVSVGELELKVSAAWLFEAIVAKNRAGHSNGKARC